MMTSAMMTCGLVLVRPTQLLIMPTVCLCGEHQAQQQQFSVSKHPGNGRDALPYVHREYTDPDRAAMFGSETQTAQS